MLRKLAEVNGQINNCGGECSEICEANAEKKPSDVNAQTMLR
jgi:hypothetical protein